VIDRVESNGRWISLQPVREADLVKLFHWTADWRSLNLWSFESESFDRFTQQFQRMLQSTTTMAIRRRATNECIGLAQLYDVNVQDGWAFYFQYLEPAARRLAYSAEAGLAFLNVVFGLLPLRKIYADVFAFNGLAYRTLVNGGFEEEGRFKEFVRRGETYWDCYRLSLTRANWEQLRARMARLVDMQQFVDANMGGGP